PGSPIQIKIDGSMVAVNAQRLEPANVEGLLRQIVPDAQWARFEDERELNIGYGLSGVGSFRVNAFRQRGTVAGVVRFVPHEIPALADLHLPEILGELILEKRG